MFAINTLRRQTKLIHKTIRMNVASRWFSTEAAQAKTEKVVPEASEEEKKKYRDAWGLKYSDEWLKFEKEWEKIAEERENNQKTFLDSELDQFQKQQVDLIVKKKFYS